MSSKMREALEFIKHASDDYEEYAHTIAGALDVIYEKACAALAEPVQNCEVGTAEEQSERFILFCRRKSFRGVCNNSCKIANVNRRLGWQKIGQARCFPFWSQMPYEEVK